MRKLLFILSIAILFIFSCQKERSNIFFQEFQKHWPKKCFIRIDSLISNDSIFEFMIHFYDGDMASYNYLEGKMYLEDNKILFASKDGQLKFPLFDFNLNEGESEIVNYTKSYRDKYTDTMINKNYKMLLEYKFFDKLLNDTVIKFRYLNYSIFTPDNDVVYYVNKNAGILGCYLSLTLNDSTETIIANGRGNIYLNTIKNKKIIHRVLQ